MLGRGGNNGCTYDKDAHAASAVREQVQSPGGEREDDNGEDQDGDLDVEEPEGLRRDADSSQSLGTHGNDGLIRVTKWWDQLGRDGKATTAVQQGGSNS